MKKLITTVFVSSLLFACSDQVQEVTTYPVKKEHHTIEVGANGDLFAAKATTVSAPVSNQGMQIVSWLAPEFSYVKKGDVVARFDAEGMQLQKRDKLNELAITNQDIQEKQGSLNNQLSAINHDIGMVGQEFKFAEQFTIDDVRIRSKLEILDQMQNTEFLSSQKDYLDWKSDSFSASSEGDMGLLQMKQQRAEAKLSQLDSGLSQLEVKAPHDGLLVYKANWRGEKPKEGQTMWPGQKIAELPDISEMKIRLHVRENEMIGIAAGNSVTFALNAFLSEEQTGVVESVAKFPKSINRGDPQKFYEVIVKIDEQNQARFLPGRKLSASIKVSELTDAVVVPLQSVFSEHNSTYVYVKVGDGFEKQEVTLGSSSLSHVQVIEGLTEGMQIALTSQEQG